MAEIVIEDRIAQGLKDEIVIWSEEATNLTIVDQQTYDSAAGLNLELARLEKEIKEGYREIKEATDKAHKTAVATEKRYLDPVQRARQLVSQKIGTWDREQREIQQRLEREAQEAARKTAERLAAETAKALEKQGASKETVERVRANPEPLPAAVVPQTYEKSKKVSVVDAYSCDCFDLFDLAKAIVNGEVSLEYIQPNQSALDTRARSDKTTFSLPGCRLVVKSTTRTRL